MHKCQFQKSAEKQTISSVIGTLRHTGDLGLTNWLTKVPTNQSGPKSLKVI
jgi:hypothetical protein